jgi:Sulphur transport
MQDPMLVSLAVLVSVLCAGIMGFAIQRGATCTVAAVDEVLGKRRANRLIAMGEASLWVAGGLALASVAGALPAMPSAYRVTGWTFAGGALLGLGAWVNKACVFGAIARFGSGEWSYAATPVGFYAGCLTVDLLFGAPAARKLDEGSPVLAAAGWVALLFTAFAAWRVGPALWSAWADPGGCTARGRARVRRLAAHVWAPHAATAVIGVTFVIILLLVGVWAYTDVLAQLARGATMRLVLGAVCLAALYAGAVLGGWTAGRWRSLRVSAGGALRCFVGGVTMAWGSLLIPGSNDGFILIGMPLLRPYAWLAFATMCVTIAAVMLVSQRVMRPRTAEVPQ